MKNNQNYTESHSSVVGIPIMNSTLRVATTTSFHSVLSSKFSRPIIVPFHVMPPV